MIRNYGKAFIPCLVALGIPALAIAGHMTQNAAPQSQRMSEADSLALEAQIDSLLRDTTATTLDNLVVEAVKPLIQSDGATLTYNAEEDDAGRSGNVLDLLRKVPMVTVDAQDNIQINGQGGFKIQMNGKDDPMLAQNASQILKNMPADNIVKVEVITEPGAKYDAEGVGGILNIVTTTKNATDGYSGTASLSFGKRNNALGLYAISKFNKVTVSVNGSYANGHLFPQSQETDMKSEYDTPTLQGTKIMHNKQKTVFDFGMAGLNLSWEPDTLNLFTLSANYFGMKGGLKKYWATERFINPDGTERYSAASDAAMDMNHGGLSAQASFQHNFEPEKHNIIATYLFNFGKSAYWMDMWYNDIAGEYVPPYMIQHSASQNYDRSHTFQLDYTKGFGKKHLLEAGGKAIMRHNSGLGRTLQGHTADLQLDPNPIDNTDITQIQNVYSLYGSYTGTFGKFSAKAGVRYEGTHMGIDFHDGNSENFRVNLNDVVPNAALSYNFQPSTTLRLAYQMRISRPGINQVNPYFRQIVPDYADVGNPDLESETINNLSITFSKYGRVLGGYVSLDGSITDNVITGYEYMKGNTLVSTYANIGKRKHASLNGYFNWTIIKDMRFGLNMGVDYEHMYDPTRNLKMCGFSGNFFANWNYSLQSGWKFSAYGGMSTKEKSLQGDFSGWHFYGFSVGKSFLKKKLDVTLSTNNCFEDRTSWTSTTVTDGVRMTNRGINSSWDVQLGIQWNFGELKAYVKKTDAQISNDDISSASSSKSGGEGGQGGQGGQH